jgi:ADP-ribose pyrophosphatase YjhB (NUDIX family)
MQHLLLKIWNALKLPKNIQLFFMRRLNDQFLIGVAGVFLDDQRNILLVQHSYRGGRQWRLPGGYAKAKEHPKEAIEREVKEETGLTVSADEKLKIRTDRESARIEIVYAGKFMGGDFKPTAEVFDAKLFAFDELPVLPNDQFSFIDQVINK